MIEEVFLFSPSILKFYSDDNNVGAHDNFISYEEYLILMYHSKTNFGCYETELIADGIYYFEI